MVTQVLIRRDDEVVQATDVAARRPNEEPLPPRVAGRLAAIFAALGAPPRLRIVHALSGGERNVGELAAALGLAVPAVSQHLRILRDLRIVRNRRDGKMVYYALDDAHVADLFAVTLAHVLGTEEQ